MTKRKSNDTLYDLIPLDTDSVEVLRSRASAIATVTKNEEKIGDIKGAVIFEIGIHEKYAVPYEDVVEVCHGVNINSINRLESLVSGIMNWRGKLLTVLDLSQLFSLSSNDRKKSDEAKSVIIVRFGQHGMVGFLVNTLLGSKEFDCGSLISSVSISALIDPDYITGLIDGEICLLNIKKILKDANEKIKQRSRQQ